MAGAASATVAAVSVAVGTAVAIGVAVAVGMGVAVGMAVAVGTAVAVGVTGLGVDAGASGVDAVRFVADTAGVESEGTVAAEAPGSDCVAAADFLPPDAGCTTVVDARTTVEVTWAAAPKPDDVPPADPVAPGLDP